MRETDVSGSAQAVVVGAGPGLGRSLALNFARHGLHVGLVGRNQPRLENLGNEVRATGMDARVAVVDAADAEALAEAIVDMGAAAPVQILAYNAMMSAGRLGEAGIQALRAASDVNIHAPVRAVQAALPQLEATKGSVLLTGGGLSLHPMGDLGVLSAGKAALRAAAFALAEELGPLGIHVRTVTITGRIQPGTALDPDRIADVFWDVHADRDSPIEVVLDG